jgi:RNA polymerase sigma-70 factor, ECF subfamily
LLSTLAERTFDAREGSGDHGSKDRVAMSEQTTAEQLLQHLDSAYNLARWLVRNGDAEDVVQEAYMRALQYSAGFRGGNARAWLLTIVRNTAYKWLRKTRRFEFVTQFDEELHTTGTESSNPEQLLMQTADTRLVETALGGLPGRFREILVLRELEGLSYREISEIMAIPMGTVMSMLSRARQRLRHTIDDRLNTPPSRADGVAVTDREAVEEAALI